MREFFEGLRSADDVIGYLAENKGQTIRAAAAAVGILTVLFLMVYQGDGEVELMDTADPLQAEAAEGSGSGSAGSAGAGTEGSGGSASGSSGTGGAYGAGDFGTDGVVTAANGMIYVDIGGAVKEPKLAELAAGSRVEDAIQAAGGLTGEADLSSINRAALLNDGEKVYVPKKGEAALGSGGADGTGGSGGAGTAGASNPGGKININTADITQLQTITGVGPVTAQKIIDYRTENGRFSSIEDLKNISGIGEKTFEKMKGDVTV